MRLLKSMHLISMCAYCPDFTVYPVGTATIVIIDIDADLSFVTKRDTNEQVI